MHSKCLIFSNDFIPLHFSSLYCRGTKSGRFICRSNYNKCMQDFKIVNENMEISMEITFIIDGIRSK